MRSSALGLDLACRPLEPLTVAADEDHVRALRARQTRGLEADAGASAEQDDGLTGELRLTLSG